MKEKDLNKILQDVKGGTVSVQEALETLKTLPYEDIGFANIDHHRAIRKGFPEVIWGEGKSADQLIGIIEKMLKMDHPILATRVDEKKALKVKEKFPEAGYFPQSRALTLNDSKVEEKGRGIILIVSAGTSDIPVSEEAAVTAEFLGNRVERIYDVGVAGIHRLFHRMDLIRGAKVIIVVAGMEGALASVMGGLVDKPVIGVPCSAGYGANFGGISALLSMLNSCASGVSVVNIDNGFGASCQANLINKLKE